MRPDKHCNHRPTILGHTTPNRYDLLEHMRGQPYKKHIKRRAGQHDDTNDIIAVRSQQGRITARNFSPPTASYVNHLLVLRITEVYRSPPLARPCITTQPPPLKVRDRQRFKNTTFLYIHRVYLNNAGQLTKSTSGS